MHLQLRETLYVLQQGRLAGANDSAFEGTFWNRQSVPRKIQRMCDSKLFHCYHTKPPLYTCYRITIRLVWYLCGCRVDGQ